MGTLPPACICLSQGRGETTLTRRSWRLEAQPSQLHFPNYPKSFKFGFRRRKQEIQKNTRKTSIIYTEEEETDREIYKRCLTPKKNQPRIKPEAFKLEFLQNLRCSIYWRAAETNLDVFWLRHLTFSFLSNFHIFVWSPPHQNSLQCLSMSRKRNQEPVDIYFTSSISISCFWRFSHFHVLTF